VASVVGNSSSAISIAELESEFDKDKGQQYMDSLKECKVA